MSISPSIIDLLFRTRRQSIVGLLFIFLRRLYLWMDVWAVLSFSFGNWFWHFLTALREPCFFGMACFAILNLSLSVHLWYFECFPVIGDSVTLHASSQSTALKLWSPSSSPSVALKYFRDHRIFCSRVSFNHKR